MYKLSEKSKQHREGVDARLIEISDLAITITLVDFGIPDGGGVRTSPYQLELFRKGLSKADGTQKLSKHQSGKALDFYAFVEGAASWRHEHLAMVATAHLQAASILGYKIKWGGLWKSSSVKVNGIVYGWDMAHIELIED